MIEQILKSDNIEQKKELFSFTTDNTIEEIELKYNLWIRHFFIKYLKSKDAPFHRDIDQNNIKAYLGDIKSFTDIAFRGGAKTSRTKLFIAFVICNDKGHYRKYLKCLAADGANSTQITTDIYNMLISPRIKQMYPEVFEKTETKREETRSSFTTATGIKMVAGTVGTDQRGALQEESRPDFIWFEDFENKMTLRSAVKTIVIRGNMEEARTSLSKDGTCVYTCNYISEQGNVHALVEKANDQNIVLIVPIIKDGIPTWNRYSIAEIDQMRIDDDDFEGERLCEPSASKEIYFDRPTLNMQEVKRPIKVSGEFKIYHKFDPAHRYAGGGDVAGGVGLDSCASVFIDFDTVPARVVGTFANNTIKPEAFGDELYRQAEKFGDCLIAPENNYGTEAILRLKQLNANIFITQAKDAKVEEGELKQTTYGWNTNALTKPKMLSALAKAVEDGLIDLSDDGLIRELKNYTRNDSIENIKDPRLTTRHFDLLMACCIAWQMKDFVRYKKINTFKKSKKFT